MCVVSMITEQYPRQYPNWPVQTLPLQQATDLREVLRKLDELDKKLGAKECAADAPKKEFLAALDKRIADLEKRVSTLERRKKK